MDLPFILREFQTEAGRGLDAEARKEMHGGADELEREIRYYTLGGLTGNSGGLLLGWVK